MTSAVDVVTLLKKKVGFDVKDSSESATQLRLLGSVPQTKKESTDWILIVHQLLTKMDGAQWSCDISKQYFIRAGKVWWGWRLIFQSDTLSECYQNILEVISSTLPAGRVELTSIPLPGATAARATRKNVGYMGTVPVGRR